MRYRRHEVLVTNPPRDPKPTADRAKAAAKKVRLDALLVERGLFVSRARAKAAIMAGDVVVGEHRVDKAGHLVRPDAEVRVKDQGHGFVSRGALKLKAALEKWPADAEGQVCLDVGASTGGFTEVWLQAGAASVYAVDVGYGQLAERLRQDARVKNIERTHIGRLDIGALDPAPTLCSIDVSFIGLAKVLPMVVPHLAPAAHVYALIKPQFEAGREHVGKGGIVRDADVRARCVDSVIAAGAAVGLTCAGHIESPITGQQGNIEYMAAFSRGAA